MVYRQELDGEGEGSPEQSGHDHSGHGGPSPVKRAEYEYGDSQRTEHRHGGADPHSSLGVQQRARHSRKTQEDDENSK